MAYDLIETSDYDATALYLYEFSLGNNVWRYTSADSDVAVGGEAWEHAAIEHDGVSQTGDAAQDNPKLTIPSNIIPALVFAGSPPAQTMMIRFMKGHDGDSAARVFWVGVVSSVNWTQPGRLEMSLFTLSATLQRQGLTQSYQRGCRHVLYGQGYGQCNVDRSQFAVPATVVTTAAGIVQLTGISAFPPGWFDGGYLEWDDVNRGMERRTIERFEGGDQVRLFGLSDGLYESLEVTLYPGCPRTIAACDTKFDNVENYGGQPHLPGDSPYDGDPIF